MLRRVNAHLKSNSAAKKSPDSKWMCLTRVANDALQLRMKEAEIKRTTLDCIQAGPDAKWAWYAIIHERYLAKKLI